MQLEKHREISLSLFCTVCDREHKSKVIAVLEGQKSFFNLALLGHGTANSRILGYLGLGETEKAVFMCILPSQTAGETMGKLDEAMNFSKPGHGIAFIAPVNKGCYHTPVQFTGQQLDEGGKPVETKQGHDMLMVVVNRGYTEEVMDVARAAGATGGTVLHARGCGLSGAEKFFGVTIQPEKEVIMILASDDAGCTIMGAIADKVGPGTDASAVSFSIPVNRVMGIGLDVPKDAL